MLQVQLEPMTFETNIHFYTEINIEFLDEVVKAISVQGEEKTMTAFDAILR